MINKEEDLPTTINADQAEESTQPNNPTGSGQPTNVMAPPTSLSDNKKADQSLNPRADEKAKTTKSRSHKTSSTHILRSSCRSTGSSRLNAKTRSAILQARIQSEMKINEIQSRQYAERHVFESNLMKAQREQQEKELALNCLREEQARAHLYKLSQAKLQAELNETLAEIAAEENENDNEEVPVVNPNNCRLLGPKMSLVLVHQKL